MDRKSTRYGSLRSIFLLATLSLTWTFASNIESAEEKQRPNIVLVYADDVDCESVFGQFPKQESETVRFPYLKEMAKQGLRFSNFHVTTPVCGPSRACLYSGQYAHRNQCRVNDPGSIRSLGFSGGYATFDPDNEMASWMKQAGYTTAHVGKYLHRGFNPDVKRGIGWKDVVPSGWDHFDISLGSRYLNFPSYHKSYDKFVPTSGKEYRTDWGMRHAIKIVQNHSTNDGPLLLCWSPIAAHIPGNGQPMIADRHKSMYSDIEIPDMETRLAATVKNQIDEMKRLENSDHQRREHLNEVHRDRLRALQALDEGVGALRRELRKQGMLGNTIFIFTSDHGFRYAQHRHFGKRLPYDRITKVPFLITGPGVPKDQECDTLLANIDIAPTLVAIAGGQHPQSCDGKSFAGMISDPNADVDMGREAILIENWGQAVSHDTVMPATYSSMRTHHHAYTEWATGGREYYDLQADPEQLVNLYPELVPERQRQLAAKMRRLRTSDAPPKLSGTKFKQATSSSRICGSLEPTKFIGYVESDAGTKSIELEIRCGRSGDYWTAEGWSSERTRIPAVLDQPNGLVSRWSFLLDTRAYAKLPTSDLSAKKVGLSIVATDLRNRETVAKDDVQFSMAFADPETTVGSLQYDRSEKRLLTVSGMATDLNHVKVVRVGVQNSQTKEYWDGKQWGKTFVQHDAEVTETSQDGEKVNCIWTLKMPVPIVTRIMVIARAYNKGNHHDHSPALKSVLMGNIQ